MAENLFTLKVKTLNGKVLEFKIPSTCSIPGLKVYITEATGTPASEQTLIFQGKVLKDEKTVADYSLKEGSTIHLVKKKVDSNAQNTQTSQTSQTSQNTQNIPNQSINFGPNVVMGTITLPEGSNSTPPNFNQILGSVFNSLGVPNPLANSNSSGSNSQNSLSNQGDPFTLLRGNFDSLQTNISQLNNMLGTSTSSSSSNSNSSSFSQTNSNSPNGLSHCEIIGQSLSRINSNFNQLSPTISHVSSLLQNESTLSNSSERQELQRIANQLGPIFHQLGHVILCVGTSLQSLRMNDTPGSAQVPPPQRPILASATVANVAALSPSEGNSTSGIQPSQLRVPLFTVSPGPGVAPQQPFSSLFNSSANSNANSTPNLNSNTNTNASPNINSSSSSSSNPNNSSQSNNRPNISNTSESSPFQSNSQSNSNPTANPFASFMNQLFSSVTQSNPSSSNQQEHDFGSIMNQLMGGIQNLNSSNNSSSTSRTQPNNPSSSYNMLDVTNSISQELDNGSFSPENDVLNEMFGRILEALSIPDIVGIMNGQLEPLQKIHPILQSYLKELLNGDESQSSFTRVVNEVIESLQPALKKTVVVPEVQAKIRPGYDIVMISNHIIRKHSHTLLKLIHKNYTVSSTNPYPFASVVKDWNAIFLDELVIQLSIAMKGGISDVIEVFRIFLAKELVFMGNDFSNSAGTIITSYLMNTYNQNQNFHDFQNRSNWKRIMDLDEVRQSYSSTQNPLSDAYLEGGPTKKRRMNPPSVENIFEETFKESIKEAKLPSREDDSIVVKAKKELLPSFTNKLKKDISRRLENDKDFEKVKSQYPLSSKLLKDQKSNKN